MSSVEITLNRHGGRSTHSITHRISSIWPTVILAGVSAGEGAGNV
jgi:hypothetical protein